jgi:hypothetical protein
MAGPSADPCVRKVARGYRLDHRLLAVVTPAGSRKTAAPEEVHRGTGAPLCRANYEEARR